ncbi:MAG TPA: two-component regulator propeller domain-containing protein [Flavobacteriales bacterium]|nr:two-component regulator propeller domain-containing protein [Flavobacteriales bacterium]
MLFLINSRVAVEPCIFAKVEIQTTGSGTELYCFMRINLIALLLGFLVSCSSVEERKGPPILPEKSNSKPVQTVLAGKPRIVNLKNCPAPEQAILSNRNLFDPEGIETAAASANFEVPLKKFSSEDGLGINAVICGFCDSRGNLWFGTNGGGVSCYNGHSFVNYTANQGLADNIVRCIAEDKHGNMWFGTRGGGISCYDGLRFRNYSTSEGLTNSDIRAIAIGKNGVVWIGTEGGGVNLLKPQNKGYSSKLEPFNTQINSRSEFIQCIYEDKRGMIWIGSKSSGAQAYDPSGNNPNPFLALNARLGLADSSVTCMLQDKSGKIWIGTNSGLCRFNGKRMDHFTQVDGLADNSVLCLFEDDKGMIWIGTQNGGVSCYDPTVEPLSGRKAFRNLTTGNGLPNNQIYSITEDHSGNLWFGSWGGGVVQYSGNSISHLMTNEGKENIKVVSLAEDKAGHLWFTNQTQSLIRYDGEQIRSFSNSLLNRFGVVRGSIYDSKGSIWFATSGAGVCRFDGKTIFSFTVGQGLAGNNTRSVFEDSKGRIWVGSFKQGVSCIAGDSILTYTTEQGLPNNEVWNIMEDRKGNIWFSTHGGGASCFTGKEFLNYSMDQGLPGNVIWNINQDDAGNLWFASDGGGVSRFDGKSFLSISVAQGLGDDVILASKVAQDGSIWLGTNKGFSVIRMFRSEQDSLNTPESRISATNSLTNQELQQKGWKPEVEIYNKRTGFPVEDFYPNSMYFDRRGVVWAGTSEGLVRFDYRQPITGRKSGLLELHAIRVNNERICWQDLREDTSQTNSLFVPAYRNEEVLVFGRVLTEAERQEFKKKFSGIEFEHISAFYPIPKKLSLPYQFNNITIEFGAIETARPSLVRYQYKLEGYDSDWSPLSDKSSATFGNIPEGDYVFLVKSRSPEGVWTKPLEYAFTVRAPWYRTWWSLGLYLILGASFLFVMFRWRTMNLVRDKKKLEHQVTERTTEVVQQKEIVEFKNREILASIKYAKRIQTAILPSARSIRQNLPNSFILYLPKDIVAGDFYWIEKVGERVLFAACDCTGHGVPGAMVSVVCNNALNRAVREFGLVRPAAILDKVADLVIENFSTSEDSIEDGMDISLCALNLVTMQLEWAGANNPLWIIREGNLTQYKPDKQPVGLYENPLPFTNHTIQLESGDQLYVFSDGYADQFGGEELEKKLTRKRFRELILSVSKNDIRAQGDYLESFLVNYRNDRMQIDDILVIGVQV